MAKAGRPTVKRKVSDILGPQDREAVVSTAVAEKPEAVQLSQVEAVSGSPESKESNYPSRRESVNRISIPLSSTGKIDFDSMQDRTKERFSAAVKQSFNDASFLKECGVAPVEVTAKPQIVTVQAAGGVLDVIAKVEAGVYAKKTGLEYDEVYQVVQWDKDDHRILDGQVSGLANKYIPASWLQYADLGVFATTMFALMKQKAELVEKLAKSKLSGYEKQMREQSPASKSDTPAPASQSSAHTSAASILPSTEIPPGESARSLEDFAPNAAPPAKGNDRSLG